MKKLVFIFMLVVASTLQGQTNIQLQKSIAIIEDLYYHEVILGSKIYLTLDISFDDLTDKISFKRFNFYNEDNYREYTDTFYLDEIDQNSITVHIFNLGDLDPRSNGKYSFSISFKTKGETIKNESLEFDKKEFPLVVKKQKYTDSFEINYFNNPSLDICKKITENMAVIIDAKNIKYTTYNKDTEEEHEIFNPFED